jgi:hypothetical protein
MDVGGSKSLTSLTVKVGNEASGCSSSELPSFGVKVGMTVGLDFRVTFRLFLRGDSVSSTLLSTTEVISAFAAICLANAEYRLQ